MRSLTRVLACAASILGLASVLSTPASAHQHGTRSEHGAPGRHHGSSTLSKSAPEGIRDHSHRHRRHKDRKTLPFTGFNLLAYAALGLGLLAAGLGLRWILASRLLRRLP